MNGLGIESLPLLAGNCPLPRRAHDDDSCNAVDALSGCVAGTALAAPCSSPALVSDFAAVVTRCRADRRESRGGEAVLPEPDRPLVLTDEMRRVFGEVVREARLHVAQEPSAERGWTATVVLASPGLGEIRVHMRRAGRRLSVHLRVGDEGARGMLSAHLGDLVAALAVLDLDVEASVSMRDELSSPMRRSGCSPSHPRAAADT